MVEVEQTGSGDPISFLVTVREGRGETRHQVTMDSATHQRLAGGKAAPDECVRAAFAFLLDREPKESILAEFDITVISRYFPAFADELPRYLRGLRDPSRD